MPYHDSFVTNGDMLQGVQRRLVDVVDMTFIIGFPMVLQALFQFIKSEPAKMTHYRFLHEVIQNNFGRST